MPDPTAKPVSMLNGAYTKKEKEFRKEMEEAISTGTHFREWPQVKNDTIAHKEFTRLRKLFKSMPFVEGLDETLINRYCMMRSEEERLRLVYDRINNLLERLEEKEDLEIDYKSLYHITSGMNTTRTHLNTTRQQMLQIEKETFMTPLSRIKAVPKKPPKEKNSEEEEMEGLMS